MSTVQTSTRATTSTDARLAQLDRVGEKLDPLRNAIGGITALGSACIVVYAWSQSGLSAAAVGLLLALGLFAVGALIGFLFGVPHTALPSTPSTAGQAVITPRYLPSTHLEDISEWLTKILVGVGLAEIQNVPGAIAGFSRFAASGLGGGTSTPPLILGIMLLFTACGFFVGYLWCRLILARLETAADVQADSQAHNTLA